MDKLSSPHVELSAPMQAVEVQAAVRHAVETIVLPAVEARLLRMRIQLQYQHAGVSAPRVTVKSQAVARLAAGITA